MKLKHEVGDFVISNKWLSQPKTGMIIARSPYNNVNRDVLKLGRDYPMVYYVLSSEGDVEGPLFSSEINAI